MLPEEDRLCPFSSFCAYPLSDFRDASSSVHNVLQQSFNKQGEKKAGKRSFTSIQASGDIRSHGFQCLSSDDLLANYSLNGDFKHLPRNNPVCERDK